MYSKSKEVKDKMLKKRENMPYLLNITVNYEPDKTVIWCFDVEQIRASNFMLKMALTD